MAGVHRHRPVLDPGRARRRVRARPLLCRLPPPRRFHVSRSGQTMAAFEGERAVVVGFGASGQAATRALQAEGASVLVSEARSREEIAPRGDPAEDRIMNEPGPELRFGGHRPEHLEGATLLVVSPGVPERAPIIGWARGLGIPVWSE